MPGALELSDYVCVALAGELRMIPSTHIGQVTTPVTRALSHPWTLTSSGTDHVLTFSQSVTPKLNHNQKKKQSVSDIGLFRYIIDDELMKLENIN